ncbi:hypothetical protein AB0F15_05400 [Amycolatopsis sp. NPDC026612]|uniref:hypothetical protein n=1 Tax=Amycolatopsis sp. NPDC026612 TaxID=3155466 RepID=UPI00341090C2
MGVVWRADGPQVLGAAFGRDTELTDVNASGDAVGSYTDPREFREFPLNHAVRYTGGHFERLPDPPGYPDTKALAINARGGAFLWHLDGSFDRALPGLRSVAAMNSAGAIVGYADGGSTLFLPPDGGPAQTAVAPAGQDARAREVAGNGDVVGTVTVHSPDPAKAVVRRHCG